MLAELQRLFALQILPALERGDLQGEQIDEVVLAWVIRDLPSAKGVGRPVRLPDALKKRAARELSAAQNLTGGARRLVAGATGLNEALVHLFGDKLFKAFLRSHQKDPATLSRLNALIAATPALLEDPSAWDSDGARKDARKPIIVADQFDEQVVLDQLKALDSKALLKFLRQAHDQVLIDRIRALFARKAWEELHRFSELFIGDSKHRHRSLLLVGRGSIYNGDVTAATKTLNLAHDLFPDDTEILIYRGVAHARSERFGHAIDDFRLALEREPASARIKRELGNALRMGSKRVVDEGERRAMASEAIALLGEALDEDFSPGAARVLSRFLYDCGAFDQCIALAERMLEAAPEDVDALVIKSRALVSLNRVSEALEISERVLELDPANQNARFMLRAMRFLADGGAQGGEIRFGDLLYGTNGVVAVAPLGSVEWAPVAEGEQDIAAQLRTIPFDWIRLSDTADHPSLSQERLDRLGSEVDPLAGFHLDTSVSPPLRLWRREALLGLAESGLIDRSFSGLSRFERFYDREPQPADQIAKAVVMSRHGSFKFGGGEHFIESMAEHYRTVGYDPTIVGTRPELRGQTGEANGFPFAFVEDSPAVLRNLFLTKDVRLVHAISGLGFSVAEALSYSNIPFVYGVHFWREVLGTDTDENFFDETGTPMPRPEFNYILSRAASVYANSEFTRDVLERSFGVRCPVVFSVPKEGAGVA